MRFLLDTNILSKLVRHPPGWIADRIADVGQQLVCTSVIVAAELRYEAAKKDSLRLTAQLEAVLGALDVLALESVTHFRPGVLPEFSRKGGVVRTLCKGTSVGTNWSRQSEACSRVLTTCDIRVLDVVTNGNHSSGSAEISTDETTAPGRMSRNPPIYKIVRFGETCESETGG